MMIKQLRLDGLLSFAPGSEPFELRPLNVLIGHNGTGKSNLIKALGLVAAASRDLGRAIRGRGDWLDWLWNGSPSADAIRIEAELDGSDTPGRCDPRCRLTVGLGQACLEFVGEAAAEAGRCAVDGTRVPSVRTRATAVSHHQRQFARGTPDRYLSRRPSTGDTTDHHSTRNR